MDLVLLVPLCLLCSIFVCLTALLSLCFWRVDCPPSFVCLHYFFPFLSSYCFLIGTVLVTMLMFVLMVVLIVGIRKSSFGVFFSFSVGLQAFQVVPTLHHSLGDNLRRTMVDTLHYG